MNFEKTFEKISQRLENARKIDERRLANARVSDDEIRLDLNNDRLSLKGYFGEIDDCVGRKILSRKLTESDWGTLVFGNGGTQSAKEQSVPKPDEKSARIANKNKKIKNILEQILKAKQKEDRSDKIKKLKKNRLSSL